MRVEVLRARIVTAAPVAPVISHSCPFWANDLKADFGQIIFMVVVYK
jgi:hypothetical protein